MMQSELSKILNLHKKWLNCKDDGERADLSGADLDFSYSDHLVRRAACHNR